MLLQIFFTIFNLNLEVFNHQKKYLTDGNLIALMLSQMNDIYIIIRKKPTIKSTLFITYLSIAIL